MAMHKKDAMDAHASHFEEKALMGEMLFEIEKKPIRQVLRENPYVFGLACVCQAS